MFLSISMSLCTIPVCLSFYMFILWYYCLPALLHAPSPVLLSTCPAACLYCDFPVNISIYAFCDFYQSLCVYLHRYSCLPVLLRVTSPVFLSTSPSACIITGIPVYLSFCVYLHRYSCLPVLLPAPSQCSCLPVLRPVPSQCPCLPILLPGPSPSSCSLAFTFAFRHWFNLPLLLYDTFTDISTFPHLSACTLNGIPACACLSFCIYLHRYYYLSLLLHLWIHCNFCLSFLLHLPSLVFLPTCTLTGISACLFFWI